MSDKPQGQSCATCDFFSGWDQDDPKDEVGKCDLDAEVAGYTPWHNHQHWCQRWVKVETLPTNAEAQVSDQTIQRETGWLIETIVQPTRYYCGVADFCDNPSHAHRFPAQADAEQVCRRFVNPAAFHITEHMWVTDGNEQAWADLIADGGLPEARAK